MTPPIYLMPGAASGAVRPRRSRSSVRLEYGGDVWLIAESRRAEAIMARKQAASSSSVMVPLRRAARAIMAMFF